MQSKCMRMLLVGKIVEDQTVFKIFQEVISVVSKVIKTDFYFLDQKAQIKIIEKHPDVPCFVFNLLNHETHIDYIISIGSDGTILSAAKYFVKDIPHIVSFQKGILGFLAQFSLEEIQAMLSKLIQFHKGKVELPFEETRLMRLEGQKLSQNKNEAVKPPNACINEIYISRKRHHPITLQIFVDGEFLTKTTSDGLLFSTPTGSTAYSLSAGGPILDKSVNGILMVPISPDSLSFRPICLLSTSVIRLSLSSKSEAMISFDSQQPIQQFGFQHELIIKMSQFDAKLYCPKKGSERLPCWIHRLKLFLGWNDKYRIPANRFQMKNLVLPKRQKKQ